MVSSNLEVVELWLQRVWGEQDENAIDELFRPDAEARGLSNHTLIGPSEFKDFHKMILSLVSDTTVTVDHVVEQGDWIAFVGTFYAVDRTTGDPLEIPGSSMCRIQDGLIQESYNHWDFMSLFTQMGLLPPDTLVRALHGQAVVLC